MKEWKMPKAPKPKLDKFDLEAEAESGAIRNMRKLGVGPTTLGKRMGSKARDKNGGPRTSRTGSRVAEEKRGLGS